MERSNADENRFEVHMKELAQASSWAGSNLEWLAQHLRDHLAAAAAARPAPPTAAGSG
jgi:hypothetical protein